MISSKMHLVRLWALASMTGLPAVAAPLPHSEATRPIATFLMAQSWDCGQRKTCGRISSCEEARYYLNNCRWGGKLDGDDDGAPCEKLCGSNN